MVLYFQMMVFGEYFFPFFTAVISNSLRVMYIIVFSITAGVMMTLGIKGILNSNSSMDD